MSIFFAIALCYAVVLLVWMLRVWTIFHSKGFSFTIETGLFVGLFGFIVSLSATQLVRPYDSTEGVVLAIPVGVFAASATELLAVLHKHGLRRLQRIKDGEIPEKS